MLPNNEIQADIVAKLKASTLVTALVTAAEVREIQWKGTSFVYPNIRVALGKQVPVDNLTCPIVKMPFDVVCFSENASSKEADKIAYAVMVALDGKHFTGTYVRFIYLASNGILSAEAEDETTWRSVVSFESIVQKK